MKGLIFSILLVFSLSAETIRVGAFEYYPAYFLAEDSTVKGFFVDILDYIAQREGIVFEYFYCGCLDGLDNLRSGEVDIAVGIANIGDRDQLFDFTNIPLLTVWGALYVSSDLKIDLIHEMVGKRVGVLFGDLNGIYFKNLVKSLNIDCDIVEFSSFDEIFKAIDKGSVDAGVVNAFYGVASSKYHRVRQTSTLFNSFDVYFAASKGEFGDLLKIIDKYLEEWRDDPSSIYTLARDRWIYGFDDYRLENNHSSHFWVVFIAILLIITLLTIIGFLNKKIILSRRVIETERLRLELAVRGTNDGIWDWDIKKNYLYLSARWKEILGYSDDELENSYKTFESLLYGADRAWVEDYIETYLKSSKDQYRAEFRMVHKDGSIRWILARGGAFYDRRGFPYRMAGSHSDITNRKELELQLEDNRDLYISSINSLKTGFAIIDAESYRVEVANSTYGGDSAIGKPCYMVSHNRETPCLDSDHTCPIEEVRRTGGVSSCLHRHDDGDGGFRLVEVTANPVFNSDGSLSKIIEVVTDVTDRVEYERRLKESEKRYRMLFENMNVAFALHEMIYDRDGRAVDYRFLEVNPAFERSLGIKKEDVVGRSVRHLLPATEDHWIETFARVALGGKPISYQNYSRELNAYFDTYAFSPEEGKFAVFFIDITERVEAEEEVRRLAHAVKQSPLSVVITDSKGDITYVNPQFEKSSGYSFQEVKGKNPRVLKSDEMDSRYYSDLWKTISSGREWQGEFHNRRKDGSLYWERASISPLFDSCGEVVNYIGIKEDITAWKAVNQNLMMEKERAEEANRAKSQFLANMSHELRTPLNGILGFSDLLSRTSLDDTQKHYISLVKVSGENLLSHISEILDFSKIEAHKMEIDTEIFSLRELLGNSMKIATPSAVKKGIPLNLDISENFPDYVSGDSLRLSQIVGNLLSNAIKFTSKGHVNLSALWDEGYLYISVEDTGCGIDPEGESRIFKAFGQADSSITRKYGGTGLGLVIAKELTELLGGSLSYETSPGVGSRFSIKIPLSISEPPVTDLAESDLDRILYPFKRVLVVDDDVVNRTLLTLLIGEELPEAEVFEAEDGDTALQIFEKELPDLLLLDIHMPGMSGDELCEELRKREGERGGSSRIFAVTADIQDEQRRRSLEAGFDGFIGKPLDIADLHKVIYESTKD